MRAFVWTGAIAMQVTLAVITLVASLLLVRSLYYLERLEPGFQLHDLGLVQIALLSSDSATVARGNQLVEQLVERVGALPGVQTVTTAMNPALSGTAGWDFGFIPEGQTNAQAAANPLNYEAIRPNYFETLRLPILRGRGFEEAIGGRPARRDRQPVAGETDVADQDPSASASDGPGTTRRAGGAPS